MSDDKAYSKPESKAYLRGIWMSHAQLLSVLDFDAVHVVKVSAQHLHPEEPKMYEVELSSSRLEDLRILLDILIQVESEEAAREG